MTLEYVFLLAIIAGLSVVQSFFGMGVLVFGTPTLLLLGYDFVPTLGLLLPASFAISLLQVFSTKTVRVKISRYLYLICLPGIGLGLWLAEASTLTSWTSVLVGGTLLLSALIRLWPPGRTVVTHLLERHLPTYHLLMGITHGVTNLGGALLAILASGTNSDKLAIRYTVAHYYLAFSAIQMLLLASILGHKDIFLPGIPLAAISAAVYLLIGERIFSRATSPFYNTALSIFVAAYGIVILIEF